ncbi:hypothetical protein B0H13DRAFT_1860896 [Mycena leptocephala]|nr:hypothetical protein B0H13DRAFT_1860896 [Mycena leptocephala]
MQLGALGTSLLFASGDGGVSGGQSQSCGDYVPVFPAGCPFITSVGSTSGINQFPGISEVDSLFMKESNPKVIETPKSNQKNNCNPKQTREDPIWTVPLDGEVIRRRTKD